MVLIGKRYHDISIIRSLTMNEMKDGNKNSEKKLDSLQNQKNDDKTNPIDEEPTEELLQGAISPQDKKNKKLFIILGIVAGVCILIALALFILAQMKTSEINKTLDLGEKYLKDGKYEEAILAFDDVIAIDAKQVSAYEGKAEVYVVTQKYDKAEKTLNEARQIEPSSKTNLLLVEVYDKTEKPDEADQLLNETITLLESELKKTSDKTELTNLYDQLISAYQRIGKDSSYLLNLCDQALKITNDAKYETLKKSFEMGNTSSNLANNGLAAIQGDWIYYRNSSDNNTLYKIKTGGTEKTKLNNDDTLYINIIGNWIYYTNGNDNHTIYKIKTDGTEKTKLNNDDSFSINVIGDWIYYNSNSDYFIYKIKTDGSEKSKLSNHLFSSLFIADNWIFCYTASAPGCFYQFKTDGSNERKPEFSAGDIKVNGDWTYFSNVNDDLSLYKIKNDGSGEVKLSDDDYIRNINVAGDWIYFTSHNNNSSLYKIKIDGTNETKLNNESTYSINVIDNWIYYSTNYNNSSIYKIRTDGTDRQKVD